MINNQIVQHNFSKQAHQYGEYALIQKNAAKKICELAKNFLKNDASILDLGSGTSFIAKNLNKTQNNFKIFEVDIAENMLKNWLDRPSNVFPILGDIKNLPFKKTEKFDAIFSSFSLQWLEDFDKIFNNLKNLLKQDGIVALCVPSSKTLEEIKISSNKSECFFNINNFPSEKIIIDSLENNGFKKEDLFFETASQTYKSATDCIKQIKNIGANYSSKRNFLNKNKLQKFNDFFAKNFNNKGSWHLIYLVYKK